MRETSESLVHLEHVSSSVFRNLLEFSFLGQFNVPQEELGTHIQVYARYWTYGVISFSVVSLPQNQLPVSFLYDSAGQQLSAGRGLPLKVLVCPRG